MRRTGLVAAASVLTLTVGALPNAAVGPGAGAAPKAAWVDQTVTFRAGGTTVYATFRHPKGSYHDLPGALLIAGSGPTDRNGNSKLESGKINTLKTLADWLSADGVASVRYDKLGSGRTGLGPFAADPDAIGVAPYEQEAAAALRFLAAQQGIDPGKLAVIGHSEGALYALLLATGHAGKVPPVHALGLLEPLSERYLDIVRTQVQAQVAQQLASGSITQSTASKADATLTAAIAELRKTGVVTPNLPYGLSSLLSPSIALYLSQVDRYDPATLAGALPAHTPVLVSCSNADVQVTCTEVNHLLSGLSKSQATVDFVHLTGVDHVLKVDPSGTGANYTKPLPFSPQLQSALRAFVRQNLSP